MASPGGARTFAKGADPGSASEITPKYETGGQSQGFLNHVVNMVKQAQLSSAVQDPPINIPPTGPQLKFLTEEFTENQTLGSQLATEVKKRRPDASVLLNESEGEMQIGLTRLQIPPERIHVAEVPHMLEVPGLRTETATVVKSGKGRIQITFDIPFEGADMINGSLRQILAQFRSYPYVPVVSPYLTRIIQPKVQRTVPRAERELLDRQQGELLAEVSRLKTEFIVALDLLITRFPTLGARIEGNPEFTVIKTEFAAVNGITALGVAFTRVTALLRTAVLQTKSPQHQQDLVAVEESIRVLNEKVSLLRFALASEARLRQVALQAAIGGLLDPHEGIIPCCLDGIQIKTNPDRPYLLRAQLSLVYFNPIPFGGILQYRDIFGEPTVDPSQAIFMQAAVSKWMTAPAGLTDLDFSTAFNPDTLDTQLRRELNTVGLGVVTDDQDDKYVSGLQIAYATGDVEAEPFTDVNSRNRDGYSSISEKLESQIPRWRTLDLGANRPGVTVRWVSGSLGNRLAAQPIPGEFYATMQYIGAKPARAVLELIVTDQDVLSEIHLMKAANQRMTTLGMRHWRRPEIHIRNQVINLMGIWTAQIDEIVTESETPDATRVRITLVEHRVDPSSSSLSRSILLNEKRIQDALKFMFRHAQAHIRDQVLTIFANEFGKADESEASLLLEELNTFLIFEGEDVRFGEEVGAYFRELKPKSKTHQLRAAQLLFGSSQDGKVTQPILTAKMIENAFFLKKPRNSAQRSIRDRVRALHQDVYYASVDAAKENQRLKDDAAAARTRNLILAATGPGALTGAAALALVQEEEEKIGSTSATRLFAFRILQRYQGKIPGPHDRYPDKRARLRSYGIPEATIDKMDPLNGAIEVDTNVPLLNFAPVTPTADELLWLASHMVRTQGNATDELDFEETDGGKVKITSKSGGDRTDNFFGMIQLVQAILHNEIAPPDEEGIRDIVLGKGATSRDFLQQARNGPTSLLYRDLRLPTYGDALVPILEAVRAHRSNNRKTLPTTIGSVRDLVGEEKALVERFIPTYRQAGQPPPAEADSMDDLAYDFTDTMLPDMPFYGRTRTTIAGKLKQQIDTNSTQVNGSLKRKDLITPAGADPSTSRPRVQHDPLAQLNEQGKFDPQRYGSATRLPQTATGTEVANLTYENQDVLITEAYSPARFRANTEDYGVDTPQVVQDIFDASTALEADEHLTLRKCFPTFRLFFIEEDTREGSWRAVDDVYGFNSLININITRHKLQPALADITLVNLEGTLDTDKFSNAHRDTNEGPVIKSPGSEYGVKTTKVGTSEIGGLSERLTGERLLRKFPLREGTRIAVMLGYSSRPDFLETVFTGKISEVTMGDFVKIIAQDYTAELLMPIVQNPPTESTSGIIELMMDSPTVEHFGRWTPFSHERMSRVELENARNTGLMSAVRSDLGVFFADPKLRNVFVSKYSNWWTKKALGLAFEESWDAGGGQKTAWDIIQEVVSYSPGLVAAVRPYDFEATLVVARPEQAYFATDGLRSEEQKYLRTRARREIGLRDNQVVATQLNGFLNSVYFHGNVRNENERFKKSGAKQAWYGRTGDNAKKSADQTRELGQTVPKWTQVLESLVPPTRVSGSRAVEDHKALQELRGLPAGGFLKDLLATIGSDDDWALVAEVLVRSIQGQSPTIGRRPGELTTDFTFRQRVGQSAVLPEALSALKFLPDPVGFFTEIYNGKPASTSGKPNFTNDVTLDRSPLVNRIDRAIKKRQTQWKQAVIAHVNLTSVKVFLLQHSALIPVFFRQLNAYFQNEPLTALARNLKNTSKKWPLNPRMKPFRRYHILSSYEDIIENQMACTRGAMWNGVAINKGEGTPLILWADDGLVKGDRILRSFVEPNADLDIYNVTSETTPAGDFVVNQYLVGFTRLAQGLRRMYRGQIICRGRPDIQPWDIVYVYDAYNQIYGPVEVERVTHHFSAETGYITTIVPHMVAVPNNHVDSLRIMQQGWLFGSIAVASIIGIGIVATGGLALIGVGALAAAGVGLGAAAAGQVVASEILTEATGTGLIGNFIGNGIHGGLKMPVKIMPLNRMGTPWVAGLAGYGRSTERGFDEIVNMVYERAKGKAMDVKRAYDYFRQQVGDIEGGLKSAQRVHQEFVQGDNE